MPIMLPFDRIRTDGLPPLRPHLDPAIVADYADLLRTGQRFPAVVIFYDRQHYWLADGFLRCAAAQAAGQNKVEVDIRPGTRRDAILYAIQANSHHGCRYTNAEKRQAVLTLLADPEWSQFSDRKIAELCAVSHPLVAHLRSAQLVAPAVVTVTTENAPPPPVSSLRRSAPQPAQQLAKRIDRLEKDLLALAHESAGSHLNQAQIQHHLHALRALLTPPALCPVIPSSPHPSSPRSSPHGHCDLPAAATANAPLPTAASPNPPVR